MNYVDKDFHYLNQEDISKLLKPRPKVSHKGTFGHMALIAGSRGMAGAAVLAAKAAIRTGLGLLTVYGPECNRVILQISIPEAMYKDNSLYTNILFAEDLIKYSALAIGPGLGTDELATNMLAEVLDPLSQAIVLDADALNILSGNKKLLDKLPRNAILTPHPKEFQRLIGEVPTDTLDAIDKARIFTNKYQVIIVLKGANTQIIFPDGRVYINSTGNTGLATGGSGDVLTGMIGSLLAQGYKAEDAVLVGVYLHGLSADLVLETESEESMQASDIINYLGRAFKQLKI